MKNDVEKFPLGNFSTVEKFPLGNFSLISNNSKTYAIRPFGLGLATKMATE
mgnify:CR=1 FL=1